jgi:hypothetical protein
MTKRNDGALDRYQPSRHDRYIAEATAKRLGDLFCRRPTEIPAAGALPGLGSHQPLLPAGEALDEANLHAPSVDVARCRAQSLEGVNRRHRRAARSERAASRQPSRWEEPRVS